MEIKHRIVIHWVSQTAGLILGILMSGYIDSINKNSLYVLALLIVLVPYFSSYIALMTEIFKVYKGKILIILPIAFFPRIFALILLLLPLLYLSFVTVKMYRVKENEMKSSEGKAGKAGKGVGDN